MTSFMQWAVVAIDAIATLLVLRAMMSPEAKAGHIRIPLAAAAQSFAVTAAFHTGLWRPQEWSDTLTLLITAVAAAFIIHQVLDWFSLLKQSDGE